MVTSCGFTPGYEGVRTFRYKTAVSFAAIFYPMHNSRISYVIHCHALECIRDQNDEWKDENVDGKEWMLVFVA